MGFLKKYRLIIGIIFLILAGIAYYFFFLGKGEDSAGETKVQTEVVKRGGIEVLVTGSGQVKAESQVDLKPVVAGDAIEVKRVYVKNDEEVKKDQIIALLDSENAQKSIRDAEINLRLAQIQLKQIEKTNDTKTEEDKWARQLKEIAVSQRSNSLLDAKDDLDDYYIKAPFDGVVTDLAVEAGDTISQTDILASVITKDLVVKVTLNEVDAAKVEVGNKVILTFDALSGIKASGEVSKVDTIGEVESGVVSYGVEITFDSPSEYLKPGMSANAQIQIEKKESVLFVSSSAVKTDKNGERYVLIVGGNSKNSGQDTSHNFSKVLVQVGIDNDAQIEIIEGLSEGDTILLNSPSTVASSESFKDSSNGLLNFGPGGGRRPTKD